MVGTNCSGTNAVRYGTMKDWVINLTVVLADGTIIKTRKRPRYVESLSRLSITNGTQENLLLDITSRISLLDQKELSAWSRKLR
jgi:D-lactate dehydrogenase (cytochrome)